MKVIGTRIVALSDIATDLFVRKELDQDHVLYLAGLYEGGVRFDPVEVDKSFRIVDGRHRREVYDLLNIKEVEVKIIGFDNEEEMIGYAFKANCGGSRPPSPGDIDHTIENLLERGLGQKAIADCLALPIKMVRTYVENVKSRLARAKLMRAVNAVVNGGISVAKAAEQYGVEIEKLKEFLSGKRKKPPKNGVEAIHKKLTAQFKSVGATNAALLKKLSEQYDDGDVSKEQIENIFKHLKDSHRNSGRIISDWEERMRAKFKVSKGT